MQRLALSFSNILKDELYIQYEEGAIHRKKKRIFDRRKNLKLKVHDAGILTYLCLLLPRQLREFSLRSRKALHSLTDINLPKVAARQIVRHVIA